MLAVVALIGALVIVVVALRGPAGQQPAAPDPSELERHIYAELYGQRTGMVRAAATRASGQPDRVVGGHGGPSAAGREATAQASGDSRAHVPGQPVEEAPQRRELAHSG